jgi:16S rRNA (guanine966-N2)-methyltransferase
MRIIAGEWRGRKIVAPKGDATRPTSDRTRETLFSMLTSRLGSFEDLSVADLFAGSGALGLEALSRGAAHCLFVEQEEYALKSIRANIASFEARSRTDVRAGSAMGLGPAKQPLDLILLDPPYETGAGMVALDKMNRLGWIGPATWIALETDRNEDVSIKLLDVVADRHVGKAKLSLLRLSEEGPKDDMAADA